VRLAIFVLAWALAACDAENCVDTDLDGYGPGCEPGEDCDPDHPLRNLDCVAVPPSDCDAEPTAPGCPCLAGGITTCLDELAGVGICETGRTICVNGFWGICEGGVGPVSERCDGVDQDCDGIVDDGVVSPCGGCTPGCFGGNWGQAPVPFEATDGFELTRLGELTLATTEQLFGNVWLANSAEATVSRIDAERAVETARYPSGGSEPARVAVDWAGDVWVVNREFEGISSVTKIAGDLARCIDRNDNGSIDTSQGPTDVRAFADDECILLHASIGATAEIGRAIAIDGDRGLDEISGGDAWVGLHDGEAVLEIDGLSGETRTRVPTPGFKPYSATFDRWGTLWLIERDGRLARIDPRADPPVATILEVPFSCYLLYGLAIDREGRIFMTGFGCDRVVSYDPALDRWRTISAPPSSRGATYDPSGERFWMAHTAAQVSEVSIDPLRVRRTLAIGDGETSPVETIGIAVDAFGSVWAISSQGAPSGGGLATRVDPEAEAITAQVPVGLAPHVQGDLTGSDVRFAFVPRAEQTHVFEGCGELPTEWLRVHVAGDPGSRGTITLEARHAASAGELGGAAWVRLGSIPGDPEPYALSFPEGGAIELRLILEVEGSAGAPRVERIGVEWRCPGPD
jgi:streptogramin lyase